MNVVYQKLFKVDAIQIKDSILFVKGKLVDTCAAESMQWIVTSTTPTKTPFSSTKLCIPEYRRWGISPVCIISVA